ncbi:MAG: hypothetical protein V3571_15740 [Pseudodesulfovibrio sp.]
MVWGRPEFERAALEAALRDKVRRRVRGEAWRMAMVAGVSVAVMAALEAAAVSAL